MLLMFYMFQLAHIDIIRQKDVKQIPDDGSVHEPYKYKKRVVIGGCFSYLWYGSFG
jgi:hypothetical protein